MKGGEEMPICEMCFKNKKYLPYFYRNRNKKICRECYKTKINIEECSICHETGRIETRDKQGKPICHNCYGRKERLISGFLKKNFQKATMATIVNMVGDANDLIRDFKILTENRAAQRKFEEIVKIINAIPSGRKIIVNFMEKSINRHSSLGEFIKSLCYK
ncbi:MAG: hypothetical protein ABIJ28_01100 [Patescibacteria group bacterium]